ncbi:hypothetical protein STRCI_008098 [Streptomyces cinnabarinus]|uniref:Uncharacterized protein n=1 Tax=Streptomyces cinnabarinus TaxID=67287 RepID=A0ABY7KSB6_9ACTN|nr:hypothetical protein [Streptomyces cinnabarinus]WAZ26515.1 hypothetical protein STRCI_008098 [Streptomyces cinnabarinus]
MTALLCETYPGGCPLHGASRWHTVVVIVVIAVIVSACAGLSPDWVVACAAIVAAAGSGR